MSFIQKIYFNDKLFILTDNKEEYIDEHPAAASYQWFSGATPRSFTQALKQMEAPGIAGVIIEDISGDALMDQLQAMYQPITAAGGIACNEQGAILMIFRRGKWDLPKGKLDDGESIEECAIREVCEETGLQYLTLDGKICDTYHIYTLKNQHFLKQTAWYKMKGSSRDKLKPQKEENIMEARWIAERDLAPYASKTYEAVKEVLLAAGLKW
jgi:ADP-ribose pyrophosphatase YjhB (NUDIX family)